MGRIHGLSTAGAQGPMQFLPSTWAACCTGDIEDAHDAIVGAATYLKMSGAPDDMDKAILAYNHDTRYLDAVKAYAANMAADERALPRLSRVGGLLRVVRRQLPPASRLRPAGARTGRRRRDHRRRTCVTASVLARMTRHFWPVSRNRFAGGALLAASDRPPRRCCRRGRGRTRRSRSGGTRARPAARAAPRRLRRRPRRRTPAPRRGRRAWNAMCDSRFGTSSAMRAEPERRAVRARRTRRRRRSRITRSPPSVGEHGVVERVARGDVGALDGEVIEHAPIVSSEP